MLRQCFSRKFRTQPGDQVIDFTTAIEVTGIDVTNEQIDLIGLVIAENLDGHRQVRRQRALATFRQKAAFNDVA